MSGGHFNYEQYKIAQIADTLDEVIADNDNDALDDYGQPRGQHFEPEVLERFKEAAKALRVAFVYAHRCDWLLSGDDGPDSFLRRLSSDLERLGDNA